MHTPHRGGAWDRAPIHIATNFNNQPNYAAKQNWVSKVNHQQPNDFERVSIATGAKNIACLDVSPTGRILSSCSAARAFLKSCEDKFIKHFFPQPDAAFQDALKMAARRKSPSASVLRCVDRQKRVQVQVNVLPYKRECVRIILFLPAKSEGVAKQSPVNLTERERAVLELSASGLRRDRIGYLLGITLPTVDMHCRNIRTKLGAPTMASAVATAVQRKILSQY